MAYTAEQASQTVDCDIIQSDQDDVGKAVKYALQEVSANMDDDGIPADQRYGLLMPTYFYALRGQAEVISRDYTMGQAHNQQVGGQLSILDYLTLNIRNAGGIFGIDWTGSAYGDLNLPTAATDGLEMQVDMGDMIGLFWHRDSTVVRHQTGLRSAVDWIPREQVWLAIARLHMGCQVIHSEGLYVIMSVAS
jgi:hypothetical protein